MSDSGILDRAEFACCVQPWDRLAVDVKHPSTAVPARTTLGVVEQWHQPQRIRRRHKRLHHSRNVRVHITASLGALIVAIYCPPQGPNRDFQDMGELVEGLRSNNTSTVTSAWLLSLHRYPSLTTL